MASCSTGKTKEGRLRALGTMAAAVLCSALLSVSLGLGTATAWADQGAAAGSMSGTEQGTTTPGASGSEGGFTGGNTGGNTGDSGSATPTPDPKPSQPAKPAQTSKASLKNATVTLSPASCTYDGKAKKPAVKVTIKVNGKTVTLQNKTDYTVAYSNNVKPTTKAKVTIKANSKSKKCSGSVTKTFYIYKAKAQSAFKVKLSKTSYTDDGKAKKPTVKVTAKVNGKTKTLKNKTNYTVSYKNNKAAGTATVVVTGKGNYTGSTTRTFTIKKAAVKSSNAAMSKKANGYSSKTKYLILVNSKSHKVGIYKGSKGNWSEVKYWTCTTGAAGTPTKKGAFTVGIKGTHFGESHGYTCWYYTQFSGNYLFHSVLYYPNSKTKIKSGVLGVSASHGCVRLSKNNAKWIYDNIPRGTKVVSY